MDNDTLTQINDLAEKVRSHFSIDYNLEGIKIIETEINDNRAHYEQKSDKEKQHISYKIGSFIGVCMVKNYNGTWIENKHGFCIKIRSYTVSPISKVYKFISAQGLFDSISSFYEIAGVFDEIVAASQLNTTKKASTIPESHVNKKSWWQFWK